MTIGLSTSISRLADYSARHGVWATLRRAGLAVRRGLFSNGMVLFYCDLSTDISYPSELSKAVRVEQRRSDSDLSPLDREEILSVSNRKLAQRNMTERFAKGAWLWLIKVENRLAGYGWSLKGCTVEPHFFPVEETDIHLFDFYVFPQYRGRGLNPILVIGILKGLGAGVCGGRAFIEAAEWNQPQLSSLRKTPFRRLGLAKKLPILRRTFIYWAAD